MTKHTSSSFLARMRRKWFVQRVDSEIHNRIFPHRRGEGDFGYSFRTREEMPKRIAELGVPQLLEVVEQHISRMPAAYGVSFRYILHRELQAHLSQFEELARRRVQPTSIDPRCVAAHA